MTSADPKQAQHNDASQKFREKYDSAWSEVLDVYLRQCVYLLFPCAFRAVDWRKSVEVLDEELSLLDSPKVDDCQYVNKLVKVHLKDGGGEVILMICVEATGQSDANLPLKMFSNYMTIKKKFDIMVLPLGMLTDTQETFRPDTYETPEVCNCKLVFKFDLSKLTDFEQRVEDLKAGMNPSAAVLMAQMKASQIQDPQQRIDVRIELIQWLISKKFNQENTQRLAKLVEQIVSLPDKKWEAKYLSAYDQLQKKKEKVSLPSPSVEDPKPQGSAEEVAIEEIKEERRWKADILLKQIRKKYKRLPKWAKEMITTANTNQLDKWAVNIFVADTLEELLGYKASK